MSDATSDKRHPPRKGGALIIIGGHEDRKGKKRILREVARRVGEGVLLVTTVASRTPEDYFPEYERAFRDLGLEHVRAFDIRSRSDAFLDASLAAMEGATGVFFTGGDQLRITSQIGDTPVSRRLYEIYERGGVIAGTSAGASAMCETMLVKGSSGESHRIGDLHMAPGLGLVPDMIIDQHFAERGRMGRLLGAVAHNPRMFGVGLDEDTAIVVEGEADFEVIGNGAVYVVDGEHVSYSNVADQDEDRVLSMFDVRLHVLSDGERFDRIARRPHLSE